MYKIICIVVVGIGIYFGCRYYEGRNDGFSIDKITTQFGNAPEWEVPVTASQKQAANAILSQPFHYLGHGFQCYAFVSDDGRYVLKFFRHQRLRPPILYDWLPDIEYVRKIKEQKCKERLKRAKSLFKSFATAFKYVPEDTGLIFVHLNKSVGMHPFVTLYDKCGQKYQVSLDDREFLLQYKATHIKPELASLMQSGRTLEAKRRIDQIFDLLLQASQKGIRDTDNAQIKKNNLGFLADRAIFIDAGALAYKGGDKARKYFFKDLWRLHSLHRWLVKEYPELADYYLEAESLRRRTPA